MRRIVGVAVAFLGGLSLNACKDAASSGVGDSGVADNGVRDAEVTDLGVEADVDSGLTPPIPREELCEELVDVYCGALSACSCPQSVIDACAPRFRALCTQELLGGQIQDAIERGAIIYDGAAARAAVEGLREAATTCADVYQALNWTGRDYHTLGGVLVGTSTRGESCSIPYVPLGPSDCRDGICVEERGEYVCFEFIEVGEECEPLTFCAEMDEAINPTFPLFDNFSKPCARTSSTSTTAPFFCSERFAGGSACRDDYQCATHWCSMGQCANRLGMDATCTEAIECATSDCRDDGTPPSTCQAGDLANGTACNAGPSCASDVCIDNLCAPAICRALDAIDR